MNFVTFLLLVLTFPIWFPVAFFGYLAFVILFLLSVALFQCWKWIKRPVDQGGAT